MSNEREAAYKACPETNCDWGAFLRGFQAGAEWQRSQQSAPAVWPTDDMVVRGAEELHDSLRMFGIDINFDTKTTGTEIQQEIVEAVFNVMLAAAPKAEPQPVNDDARDAARYRWLREQHNEVCSDIGVYDGANILRGEFSDLDLDYSIDALMGSNGDE